MEGGDLRSASGQFKGPQVFRVADPDVSFHFDADLDPTFHFDADLDLTR